MKKTIVTILMAAFILYVASHGLHGVATDNAQDHHESLLPEGESFVVVPYDGEDANIQSIHKSDSEYVIETVTDGYADKIHMLVGVNSEGLVTSVLIQEAHETAGLGNDALTDREFLSQFLNSSGPFEIATDGEDAFSGATATAETQSGDTVQIDGLTGATVTSKAIAASVNSAVGYVTGADVVSSATAWGG